MEPGSRGETLFLFFFLKSKTKERNSILFNHALCPIGWKASFRLRGGH